MAMYTVFSNRKGFTLIELLVVMSLISMMSSVIMAGLSDAKKRATDSAHISTIRQLETAAKSYYIDNNYFPAVTPETLNGIGTESQLITELVSKKYLSAAPPVGTITSYSVKCGGPTACTSPTTNSNHFTTICGQAADMAIGFTLNKTVPEFYNIPGSSYLCLYPNKY